MSDHYDTNDPNPPDRIYLNGCDHDGHWELEYVRQQLSEGVEVEIENIDGTCLVHAPSETPGMRRSFKSGHYRLIGPIEREK